MALLIIDLSDLPYAFKMVIGDNLIAVSINIDTSGSPLSLSLSMVSNRINSQLASGSTFPFTILTAAAFPKIGIYRLKPLIN